MTPDRILHAYKDLITGSAIVVFSDLTWAEISSLDLAKLGPDWAAAIDARADFGTRILTTPIYGKRVLELSRGQRLTLDGDSRIEILAQRRQILPLQSDRVPAGSPGPPAPIASQIEYFPPSLLGARRGQTGLTSWKRN